MATSHSQQVEEGAVVAQYVVLRVSNSTEYATTILQFLIA